MTVDFEQFGPNAGFIKELYEHYLTDPSLVGDEWIQFFQNLSHGTNGAHVNGSVNGYTNDHAAIAPAHEPTDAQALLDLNERALRLVRAYRERGHLKAKINPLTKGVLDLPTPREVKPEQYGFTDADQQSSVRCDRFQGQQGARLADLISGLEQTYCDTVGFEFMHLNDSEAREFLRERIEARPMRGSLFDAEERKRILLKLVEAEVLENELHRKYVGQKRFSLQGGETLIPMLDTILNHSPEQGVREVVIGMPHRGRLNVLCNTVGKPLSDLFNEFEDQSATSVLGSGDVKYHLGYTGIHQSTRDGEVKVSLAPNPSHLEFVGPVVEGIARAMQDTAHNRDRLSVLPVLLHGDAAFIGQGVVYETLNLMSVPTYATGGTIHIVVNNQVGFTTNPHEARSTIYCTDMARAFDIPVFHVNAEDPEACCWVTELALKYRAKFQKDVVLDLYCYRKYGHNEGDDPNFTQPSLYSEINSKKSIATLYTEELAKAGVTAADQYETLKAGYLACFKEADTQRRPGALGDACPVHGRITDQPKATKISKATAQRIGKLLAEVPEDFNAQPKLQKILEKRVEAINAGQGIDWGTAEALAFGALINDGVTVRLSGQDCGRGTFSQRHLLLSDTENANRHCPLDPLAKNSSGARMEIMNSTLSEAAVMGFEFGFAAVATNSLTLWEGQFGDFANGAQVIIDQFITSSEAKWAQRSGITLLLPHGYEGQGPEHSSARLERFLQLCAEGNVSVCYPSKASQHFHLMRRQGLSAIKRPLVVMTPKSLLRNPAAAATIEEITEGHFEPVISEDFGKSPTHVVFLTGKVVYDVAAALTKEKVTGVRVIRLEELYPFPEAEIKAALKELKPKSITWVQEEPQNMGAWSFVAPQLAALTSTMPTYVGRAAAASPATGSGKAHARELNAFISDLLKIVR